MACLIGAFYRHSLLTPLTLPWASSHPAGRMRKIKFALLSEQFVARDEQHRFSLRGVNPILARTSSFFRRLCCCSACRLRLSPPFPDGFVLVRWEGGLCGDFCALLAALLFLRRGVLAGRRGRSIFFWEKNPASDIITRCLYACIHVRTHCHSLTALSLSIFIICRSVCSRIISHTFSGIVWRWGLRGWELGTSQSLAKWNGHYILRFISWCTVSVFGVSRGCKDRAFNTYNGSCQIGLSNAKS